MCATRVASDAVIVVKGVAPPASRRVAESRDRPVVADRIGQSGQARRPVLDLGCLHDGYDRTT
jgi:hypothetical protein